MPSKKRILSPHPALEPHQFFGLQDHVRWVEDRLALSEAEERRLAEAHGRNTAEYAAGLAELEKRLAKNRPLGTPARLVGDIRWMETHLTAMEQNEEHFRPLGIEPAGPTAREQAIKFYREARERAFAFKCWIPSVTDRFPSDADPRLGLQDIRIYFDGIAETLATRPISPWLPGILFAIGEILDRVEQTERAVETPTSQAALAGMTVIAHLGQLRQALERYRDDPRGRDHEAVFTCQELVEAVEARNRREEDGFASRADAEGSPTAAFRLFRLTEGEIEGFRQVLAAFESSGAAIVAGNTDPARSGAGEGAGSGAEPPEDPAAEAVSRSTIPPKSRTANSDRWREMSPCGRSQEQAERDHGRAAIPCTQTQVAEVVRQSAKTTGLVRTLHRQGVVAWFERRTKENFLVIMQAAHQHAKLEQLAGQRT